MHAVPREKKQKEKKEERLTARAANSDDASLFHGLDPFEDWLKKDERK